MGLIIGIRELYLVAAINIIWDLDKYFLFVVNVDSITKMELEWYMMLVILFYMVCDVW